MFQNLSSESSDNVDKFKLQSQNIIKKTTCENEIMNKEYYSAKIDTVRTIYFYMIIKITILVGKYIILENKIKIKPPFLREIVVN